jgi:Glycosyl hydrolases family 16
VKDGIANMRMRTINGRPRVCAPEPKINGPSADRNQHYGRYEARFRADATDGYKLAWLLWPKSGVWPRDGEIDFPEGDLQGSIGAFMHRQNGTSGGDQDAYRTTAMFPDWHTAVIEWKPNSCKFILDGTTIGHSTSRVPNTPMHWVLQSQTELNSTYPAASAVANVQVDYVRVWKYVA